MYLTKTPEILKPLYSDLVWNLPSEEKVLYLTFDDGPIPEVTPQALDLLRDYDAKATFFCVGENVRKHPELYARIIAEGHTVGNHTQHHLNGWKTNDFTYYRDVIACREKVASSLFRPPYGKIKRSQVAGLKQQFHLIMWDVLSADFDLKLDGEQCLQNILKNAKAGSIVVLHDSLKAADRMLYALPRVLDHYRKEGWKFPALTPELITSAGE